LAARLRAMLTHPGGASGTTIHLTVEATVLVSL
jgi:hypothetical protein